MTPARLDQFRLRRGLEPGDGPAYAAARLAALDRLARDDDPGPAWRPLGPFAIPHGRTAGSGPGSRPRVAGRVAAVAVDPGDPRHLLAAGGGVWESRDGGSTWAARTDDLPTAAVGAVAFAPGDPAVAYAGTGQGELLAALGVGLLRSEDGGATWRALVASELLGAGFHDLLVDPGDPRRLLAATTAGLWSSADGGLSWEPRLAGRSWSLSAGGPGWEPSPAGRSWPGPPGGALGWDSGELLAGGEFGVHRSGNGGGSWERVPLAAAPGGFDRVAVAHGPGGQAAYVFAAGDGVGHLWRRERAGGEFGPVKPPADLDSRQAWHSWACAADPGDPEAVWLGAAGLHRGARGADGRWSWTDLAARPAGDSLPPGQHAVVFEPGDPRALYAANDGGLFRSPDGGRSWRSLAPGLAVAEADRLADHGPWLLAGAGELGTLRYEGGEVWCPVGSGDPAVAAGGELVATEAGGLAASADGGSTWTTIDLPGVRGKVTALAAAGPDRLLAGTTDGELARLERTADGWMVAGTARPRPGWVAGVAADPERPGVAWAAWSGPGAGGAWRPEDEGAAPADRGGNVWRSEDGGATWGDRGRGLPPVPVGAVVPDPDRPGTVLAATDAGVWRSDDDGAGWRPLGRGLPGAPALALALRRAERLLRVGLLGRGVWELRLDEDGGPVPATPALRSGRSPAARPRPGGPWWECPDIKLEVPPAPGGMPVRPVDFEDDRWPEAVGLPELGGRVVPDQPARVHVQVHHRGDGPLRDVRVRVLAVPACLRPPDLRAGDWVLGGDPPPGSPWRPVAPPTTLGDLLPGRSAVATFDWHVPWDLPRDICLLAAASATGGGGRADPNHLGAVDPADLVVGDGRWGLKSLTVLERWGEERVLLLDLLGSAGRGPFTLAAEGWVAGLVAGIVLPGRLGGLAREAGLVAERVAEPWRPEVVGLVREDPRLAERLDLASAFAIPAAGRGGGLELWLQGMELAPDRADPLLLLLGRPPPAGRGCLLLLDADGGVLGGHTFQVAALTGESAGRSWMVVGRRPTPRRCGQPAGSARSCISQAWSRTCQAIRRMA